jgi:hypothetical protein
MPNPQISSDARHQTTIVELEIEHAIVVCFRREAQRRDVPVTRLLHDLLDVIAAEQLTTAILDDGPRRPRVIRWLLL